MVECEACSQWSHSKCVGITSSLAPTYPYVCPFCIKSVFSQIEEIRTEVSVLQSQLSSLELSINCDVSPPVQSEIQRINDSLSEISVKLISNISKSTQPPTLQVPQIPTNSTSANKSIKPADIDRNLNIVIYGIKECPKGTSKFNRAMADLKSVTSIISKLDSSFNEYSIRDFLRLGRYQEKLKRPRPLLVKFNRAADVSKVLSKRNRLDKSFIIKPDLSPTDRAQEALLLKERWSLIQLGHSKSEVKIRGSCIFINKKLHGQVINFMFQRYPQLGDDAPNQRTSSVREEHAPVLDDLTPSPTSVPDQSSTRVSTSKD